MDNRKIMDYCSDCDKEIQLDRDTYYCSSCEGNDLMVCENCFYENHTNHNKGK
jgi:Zn finger protein HypA/HybF involved in hydrogenase expression